MGIRKQLEAQKQNDSEYLYTMVVFGTKLIRLNRATGTASLFDPLTNQWVLVKESK